MKKLAIAATMFVVPMIAAAQALTNVQALVVSIGNIINIAIPIVFALAMLYFFFGLAQYILASGDETKKEEGKNKMIWGMIALFVMSAVWGIILWVGSAIGIQSGTGPGFKSLDLVPK